MAFGIGCVVGLLVLAGILLCCVAVEAIAQAEIDGEDDYEPWD